MKSGISAARLRLAALGGLLVVPALAGAQLKCVASTDKEISRVSFDGNKQFTGAALQQEVLSEPTDLSRRIFKRVIGTRRCLRPGSGLLAGDSARLKGFYADQGFPDAKVSPASRPTGAGSVDIVFQISEGQPVLIDSMFVHGLEGLDLGTDLPSVLKSRVGGRFSLAMLLNDVDTIETRLRNSGYPGGQARKAFVVREREHRASVGLTIDPGPKTRFGQITIADTAITGRPSIIGAQSVRQLLAFKEGDLYRERLLTQSQRQLYQLGTFFHAEVKPEPDSVHDYRTDSLMRIHVGVVEDFMRQLNWPSGWGTQDCFQTGLQYSDKAFAHSINRFELSGQVSKVGWASPTGTPATRFLCSSLAGDEIASSKLNYNTAVRLTQPASFGGRLDRSFAAYSEVRGAYKAYSRTTIIGGAASISKDLATQTTPDEGFKKRLVGQLSYNLEYGHTDAPPQVLCFIFRYCDSTQSQLAANKPLAVLSGVLSRDWRDSPLLPTSGTLARVEGRLSSTLLGSDSSVAFRKGIGDLTWYHPGIKSDVIAIRVRGGIIGGGAATNGARLVPPQERLYTGGETSVRGFGPNELGPLIYVATQINIDSSVTPRDTTFNTTSRTIPTGGNGMVVLNLEYRVHGPIFGNRLQTILFVDGGKLWTSSDSLAPQPFKWSPGIAFRVFSPFGPIQVNIAYNNYRQPFGPVFYDPGITGTAAPLVCLSNQTPPSAAVPCQSTYAPPLLPASWKSPFRRLKFSIAFPPDY